MIRTLVALAVLAAAAPVAPTLEGDWKGAIEIMGGSLGIEVSLRTSEAGPLGTIDIPLQGARGVPLAEVRLDPPKVHFELPAGPGVAVFDGTLGDDGTIEGTFTQGGASGTFRLSRVVEEEPAAPALPYRDEEVSYETKDGVFAGTLSVPSGPGPHPAAILITGSGPQNRDEEIFGFRPFRLLADHLARNGIAVLRFDDRGVGGTTADPRTATTEDFARDVRGALTFAAGRPEIDAKRIGLLGHSEGGIVAPLVAAGKDDVAFIVLISGSGVTGERILLDQAALIGKAEGASEADLAKQAAFQKRSFEAARTGSGWDAIEADARKLGQEQIAALSEDQRKALGDPETAIKAAIDGQLGMARSPWFKFFLDYDPAKTLESVRCPVLAIFGGLDLQVPAESNREAIAEALARGGNDDVTIEVFPDANHLYQRATTGSPSEYTTLAKEFVPGFLDTIAGWIRTRTGLGPARATAAAASPSLPSLGAVPDAPAVPPPAAGSAEAAAHAFLDLLRKEDFVGAAARFDATMSAAMSPAALEATWRSVLARSGPFKAVTRRTTQAGPDGIAIVDLVSAFENGRLTVRVVLDKELAVAGLWFRAAPAAD